MLCLGLVLAVINFATLCNSVAINSYDFVVTNPALLNENVWINCTGHTDPPNEKFEGIELMKDDQQFYMYFSNETNRIRTLGLRGIDQSQIETFVQYPGSARIKNPTESVKGKYHCRYWFLLENKFHRWTDSGDKYIDAVVGGTVTPPPTLPPTQPPTPPPTVPPTYNDTAVINNFDVSQPIMDGDDFTLNCTPSLSANQTLISLTISKDNVVFYNYSDNKVKILGFPGITIYQIQYTKNTTGSVMIKAANTQVSGLYKCELTILTVNKTKNSAFLLKNITITKNNWSPVITRFITPNVIVKDNDFWVNCTYNPTIFEKLINLSLSKDCEIFYSYNGDKIHVSSKSSINIYKIITPKDIGSVKIEDAIPSYKGVYRCSVTAQKIDSSGTNEGTTTSEAFIDFSEAKNHHINNFEAPSKFGNGDDLFINCSINLETGVTLNSLTISKDDRVFYTYKTSIDTKPKIDVIKLSEIPDSNQIKPNKEQVGVVTLLYATANLKGNYKCEANLSTENGPFIESVSKYIDYTSEWKPDIYRFYVPDSIRRGSKYFWTNCSLAGLTTVEMSQFLMQISKDSEVFYEISSNTTANTYSVHGLETYQFDTTDQFNGSVRINDPTIESRGIYRCTLTTTRSGESKAVYKEYFVDYSSASALIFSTPMYFVIIVAISFNL